jgi:hypothetical protein
MWTEKDVNITIKFRVMFQGYRTGYIYKHPLIKEDIPKLKSDVEVPPAVSSLGYLLEEEQLYKDGWVRCVTRVAKFFLTQHTKTGINVPKRPQRTY